MDESVEPMPPPTPPTPPPNADRRLELLEGGIVAEEPTTPAAAVDPVIPASKSINAAVALTMGILLSLMDELIRVLL